MTDGPTASAGIAGTPSPVAGKRERTLRRLMRKPATARLIADSFARLGPGHALIDASGRLIAGDEAADATQTRDIRVGERVIGTLRGPVPDSVHALLLALAEQDDETRALAQESLASYKEVTMLYDLSSKIIVSPDPHSVATLICEECERFLGCDSVSVLLLNDETGRLELAAGRGLPFHTRAAFEVGDDIVASVLRSGTGEIVNEVPADPRGIAADNDLRSIVCSPLKTGSGALGVVIAGTQEARHFNAGDLQLLNAMAAQAATAIEVARLDRDLKASSQKPADLIYGVGDRPPVVVSAVLGLQHVFLAIMSLAYPVLITLEAGASRLQAASVVSMSLIAMAVATLLQARRFGPIGSGFLAPHITSAIYLAPSLLAARLGGLGLVFGMTIVTGLVAIALAPLLRRFRKLFPPEVSGVVVLMVGLSMVPVALQRFLGLDQGDAVAGGTDIAVGAITLGTIIALTVLPLGRLRLYSTLGGMLVGYGAAFATGMIDAATFADVGDLPVIGLSPLPDVTLSFSAMLIIPFLAGALATVVKDAGLIISCEKTNDAGWKRADTRTVSGGVIAGGVGNIVSGALGGIGLGLSAGSVGLAAATGATARVIALFVAAMFLALAFMPKLTAAVALMPAPVMGAGLLYVACHLVTSGAGLIASRMLDARRTYIIGLSLLGGVGGIAMPDVFQAAPAWTQGFLASPLAIATILAVGLNALLSMGVSSKAHRLVRVDEHLHDEVARYFDRRGAAWGARGDVIRRVAPAVTEWCEEIGHSLAVGEVAIDLEFDEYRLVATVQVAQAQPAQTVQETTGPSLHTIAARLAREYDCRTRIVDGSGIVFTFEH